MIFDFELLILIVLIILFSRLLPAKLRYDFLSLVGFLFLALYAPLIAWLLFAAFAYTSICFLKRRKQFFKKYYLLLLPWLISLFFIPKTPFLFTHLFHWYFLRFNLQRIVHFYFEDKRNRLKIVSLRDFFNYVYYIPIIFGTIEWFYDFYKPIKDKNTPIYYKKAFKHFIKAFGCGYLSLSLETYLVKGQLNFYSIINNLSLLEGVLHIPAVGLALYLIVLSNFEFARFLAALAGHNFERQLFGKFWQARSVIEFWVNWNIPNIIFFREYLLMPIFEFYKHNLKKSIFIALIIFWLIQAYLHEAALWAFLNALAIYIEFKWRKLQMSNESLRQRYRKYIPDIIKIIVTLLFILISATLLV